jgi:SH3-like domain-containing protein
VAENAVILYDGPTTKSTKLFVVNKGYPLEVVVTVEGWMKVRDANGSFSWVEGKQLTERRTVMVKVPVAEVRAKPDDAAPVAFQAQQNVLLDVVNVSGGWIQVRHRDGGAGYVKAQQVWGA